MASADHAQDYPPELSEERLMDLIAQIKVTDPDRVTGMRLTGAGLANQPWIIIEAGSNGNGKLGSIAASGRQSQCFPTIFPRARFQQAQDIMKIYNKLYCAIAEDEDWIFNAIKDLLSVEPLATALWGIYEATKEAGPVQNISIGVFRSDYMLHVNENAGSEDSISNTTLQQVEFNSFSCSGASHANKVADMHRHLARTGVYNVNDTPFDTKSLPGNKNIESLASSLESAHTSYGPPRSSLAKETAVLYIVQPFNFNIADERPIEYALWSREQPVPTYRLDFGPDVLEYTRLTESRELLFQPPWLPSSSPVEISVVYMRAGYEAREYNQVGWDARFRLETSAAIKCPSILGHLATFKKVQQALTAPGALERFLTDEEAATIRDTFVHVYPLDDSSEGQKARALATDPATAKNYILKPSLEGGGNNTYGDEIPNFLASIPQSQWSSYILMERIQPPPVHNLLMSSAGLDGGEIVSELGILGTCMWRKVPHGCTMLDNSVAGWTFKAKHSDVDEMSVVKGYGCFDTPYLVDT